MPSQNKNSIRLLSMGLIGVYALLMGLSGIFALPPIDRDESRFIQATTQMLETGDYINIRYQETERNKKPAGIYWLQAGSVSLFSDVEKRQIWAYRLPSLISVILAAMLVYLTGAKLFSHEAGVWAALLMASAPVFAGEATIAKTDATLFFTVMLAQFCLLALWQRHRQETDRVNTWLPAIGFWLALGAGILIKGPITPMISFLTIGVLFLFGQITLSKFLKCLKPVTGLVILFVMIAPWAAAIYDATDGRFFSDAVGTDMLGKVTQQQERHGGPFGYHLMALWFFFWPAALFLPRALLHALQERARPSIIFCLAWLVPGWLVFELTSTKLPHYTLPLYPALALLVGFLVSGVKARAVPALSKTAGILLYALPSLLLAALMIWMPSEYRAQGAAWYHYGFAAVTSAGALIAIIFYIRNKARPALLASIVTSFLSLWMLFDGVLAQSENLYLSPRIASTLHEAGLHPLKDQKPAIALVGYHEPSAVFLLGTETYLTDAAGGAAYLTQARGHVTIVESRYLDDFKALIDEENYRIIAEISGFNYSNNKSMVLIFFQSQ